MEEAKAKRIVKRLLDKGIDARVQEDYVGYYTYGRKTTGVIIRGGFACDAERACRALKRCGLHISSSIKVWY